jgi:oxygen-independent coproporphyrinogen-3 oxidase
MYALPGQTMAQLDEDLNTALALQPPHLSIYQLTVEPNTFFAKHPPTDLPVEDTAYDMLESHHCTQLIMGMQRYEVSAYAQGRSRGAGTTPTTGNLATTWCGRRRDSKLSFAHRVVRMVKHR